MIFLMSLSGHGEVNQHFTVFLKQCLKEFKDETKAYEDETKREEVCEEEENLAFTGIGRNWQQLYNKEAIKINKRNPHAVISNGQCKKRPSLQS